VNASAAFYTDRFGWEVRGGSASHLGFTDASGNVIGAFVTDKKVSADPGIVLYNYVHGFDATLAKMVAAGSTVVREPYLEGDVWAATLTDPAGNVIGIWQFDPR
jgi:predicted enzyme related to lactoylglutathione lyase